jgi:cysteine desulfurase family protein (TIGR01976 family)
MGFDIARLRGLFPALGDGWIHFDAQTGMQVPEAVAATVAVAMRTTVGAPGGKFPSALRGQLIIDTAREAIADLVGADAAGVVLGSSSAVLLARLAGALGSQLSLGTEVVVSRLDDHANIAPWQRVASQRGASVRWAEIDIETCELPEWQYANLINESTKVVAVTAASGVLGTCPDVRAIADRAHAVGALLVVDATSAAPFGPLDIEALGADVLAVCSDRWGGPPVGALAFRDTDLLESLPSEAEDPSARGPQRLEVGVHQYSLLAGLVASVDHLAALCDSGQDSRRERLLASMGEVASYQAALRTRLADSLQALPQVLVLGGMNFDDAARRVPTLSFTVNAVLADAVVQRMADNGLCAVGSRPGDGVFDALGVTEYGGAVQVGLGHYTTALEVDKLVRVVASFG